MMDTKVKDRNVWIKKALHFDEVGVLVGVILLCSLVTIINPKFLNAVNLSSLLENISYIMIASIAMTMVMITASFDLSVGSIMAFASCVSALLMKAGVNVILSVIIGLIAAGIFGMLNAVMIVKLRIPSFIATLGSMYIARGVVEAITQGKPIYPLPESFSWLGDSFVMGIPVCAIIMVILALIANYVLKDTTYGRSLYAIGGNLDAARLSGINVHKIQMSVYVLSSIMAGLTGLIMTSKMSSAQISLGTGWEMKIIASVVIGGTSMMGGIGSILGTMLGAVLMSVISNGMVLMRVSVFWQDIAIGFIIIFAVGIDVFRRQKAGMKV